MAAMIDGIMLRSVFCKKAGHMVTCLSSTKRAWDIKSGEEHRRSQRSWMRASTADPTSATRGTRCTYCDEHVFIAKLLLSKSAFVHIPRGRLSVRRRLEKQSLLYSLDRLVVDGLELDVAVEKCQRHACHSFGDLVWYRLTR